MIEAREVTIEAVKALPPTCSIEDVLGQVYVVAQVLEGLEDAEAGRVLTTEQVLKMVDEWGPRDPLLPPVLRWP